LSGASLAGVPFFSGFLSKEAILTALFLHNNMLSWLMLVVIVSVSFLTVLYTFRMVWFIFFGESRTVKILTIEQPPLLMRVPVLILAFCSLWFLVSWNPFDFKGWMLNASEPTSYSLWITVLSVAWVVVAFLTGWLLFRTSSFRTNRILKNSFYLDQGYSLAFGALSEKGARASAFADRAVIDKAIHGIVYLQVIFAHFVGWIDRVFVDGTVHLIARLTGLVGKVTRSFQGGNIQLYIFWAVFAIIIFIIWTLI
jgi:NADH-quinone oxidoreductase subunit L